MTKAKDKKKKSSHTARNKPSKQAKHRRRALKMLRKSVEYRVRLAYARVPLDALTLSAERLQARDDLVNQGYLRIEELERLNRTEAITQAMKRLDRQVSASERQRL
jgi:uncharacterized protein YnzC (UPF0291/DUF896 family)